MTKEVSSVEIFDFLLNNGWEYLGKNIGWKNPNHEGNFDTSDATNIQRIINSKEK